MPFTRDKNGLPIFENGEAAALRMFPDISILHKFGHNAAINVTEQTIWTGTNSFYVWPGSSVPVLIASTDSEDSVAGSGLQKILIEGLTSGYVAFTGVACLTGLTPVPITLPGETDVIDPFRINRMSGLTLDGFTSERRNAGNIWAGNSGSFTAGVAAVKVSHIAINHNQTLQAFYTTNNCETALIRKMNMSVGEGKSLVVRMYKRKEGGVWNINNHFPIFESVNPNDFTIPDEIEPKTDIDFTGKSSASGTDASVEFDMKLINHNFFANNDR